MFEAKNVMDTSMVLEDRHAASLICCLQLQQLLLVMVGTRQGSRGPTHLCELLRAWSQQPGWKKQHEEPW